MKYLLDTDICIFFLQGKYSIKEKILGVGVKNCFISEITIAELKYGAEHSLNKKRHSKEVVLIEELFSVLPIYESLDEFAIEKSRLKKLGYLIPDFDLLIGVTATSNDLFLVSNNVKHLKRISRINIIDWLT